MEKSLRKHFNLRPKFEIKSIRLNKELLILKNKKFVVTNNFLVSYALIILFNVVTDMFVFLSFFLLSIMLMFHIYMVDKINESILKIKKINDKRKKILYQ